MLDGVSNAKSQQEHKKTDSGILGKEVEKEKKTL